MGGIIGNLEFINGPHPDPVPFAGAYWVVPGRFLAGPSPVTYPEEETIRRIMELSRAGIDLVIDLTEPHETRLHAGYENGFYDKVLSEVSGDTGREIARISFPIRDFSIPPRVKVARILDEIDSALERGKSVYVHCRAGLGRTGLVVGCFLARHGHPPGIQVLDAISQLRKRTPNATMASPITGGQIEMVMSWVKDE